MNDAGVYLILNKINGMVYIGSSRMLRNRWTHHRSELNRGIHANDHLKSAWEIHGESAFEYKVIARCEEQDRIRLETMLCQQFKAFDRRFGYNVRDPFLKTVSDETRLKCRLAVLGEKHPLAKLSDAQAASIKARLDRGEQSVAISKEFGVSNLTIWNIKQGIRGSATKRCLNGVRPMTKKEMSQHMKDTGSAKRLHTPEARAKQRATMLAIGPFVRTPELRERMRKKMIGRGRFTETQMKEMRALREAGAKLKEIAVIFGSSPSHVCNMLRGKISARRVTCEGM